MITKDELKTILKKINSSVNSDSLTDSINLLEEGVLDSLEMVELITILESDYKFNYDKFEENFDSINIKNIVGFINNEKF